MNQKTFSISVLLVALVGFFDSLYLTNSHYSDPAACTTQFISNIFGIPVDCGAILTSQYATIIGLPISIFGMLYYLSLILIVMFERQVLAFLQQKNIQYPKFITALTSVGFLASTGLIFIQVAILVSICLYCMLSAISSYTLFILSLLFYKYSSV